MMNIRKMLRFVGGALTITMTAWLLFLSQAPTAEAINRPTNADIFTGRIIPAFIGEAYDPKEAFAELAGLPVYVFTFDFWAGFNEQGVFTSESWINSNLAVRTQIRADGSFQVQGLPAGSYYGVYFPFLLNGGRVDRADCTNSSFQPSFNDQSDTPTNPCRVESGLVSMPDWNFRMPQNDDKILDVFSYKANYLPDSQVKVVDSQIATSGGRPFEQIAIRHAFVTTRSELDIDNNINTFPVVPNKTLRISMTAEDPAGTQYEVWAQRITRTEVVTTGLGSTGYLTGVLDFPIIRGRAIVTNEYTSAGRNFSRYTFQAYAPEGYYAIIVWRKESASPSYSDWDGIAPLNSSRNGWAQQWVTTAPAPAYTFDTSSDWRRVLNLPNEISLFSNRITVWGTVTNDFGSLLSDRQATLAGTQPNAQVLIESDLGLNYGGYLNGGTDQNERFSELQRAGAGTGRTTAVRGIYAFNTVGAGSIGDVPRSDDVTIILDNSSGALGRFNRAAESTGFFRSTDGPRRVNLVAQESASGNEGYDEGILITAPGPGGEPYAAGARVTIAETGSDQVDVPAEQNIYYTNRIGQVHIPPADLRPIVRPGGTGTGDLTLKIHVRYNQYAAFNTVNYSQGSFQRLSIGGWATSSRGVDHFNLAALNWIQDALTPESAYAGGGLRAPVGVTVRIPGQSEINGRINVNVYQVTNDNPVQCDIVNDCILYQSDGATALSADPTVNGEIGVVPGSGSFVVSLPAPMSGSDLGGTCFADPASGFQYCDTISQIGVTNSTYDIVIQGNVNGSPISQTRRVSIDSLGTVSPPQITIDLEFNCQDFQNQIVQEQSGRAVTIPVVGGGTANDVTLNLDLGAQMNGFAAGAACAIGDQFAKHTPGVLSAIYKYGLQTRALTQDQAIIQIYDVIRNVVNVLFVLIFIIIGVMTILRYQPEQWHISVVLPQLLMGLVLANFSLIIVQALLDINNFLSASLFQFTREIMTNSFTAAGNKAVVGVAGVGAGAAVIASFAGAATTAVFGLMSLIAATGGGAIIGIILFGVIFVGLIFFQIMMLLLIFFARYAIIWLIVISAPAVFAFSVLPWFEGLRKQWFSMIVSVTFIQTAVAGVLSVGILLLTIGADEQSMFAGFGSALIAIITLAIGIKMPQDMLKLPIALPTAAAASAGLAKWAQTRAKRNNASDAFRARQKAEQEAQDRLVPPSKAQMLGRGASKFAGRAFSVATLGAGGALATRLQESAELARQDRDKMLESAGKAGKKAGTGEALRQLGRKGEIKGQKMARNERLRLRMRGIPELKNINSTVLPKADTVYQSMPETLPITDMQGNPITGDSLAVDSRTGKDRDAFKHLKGKATPASLRDVIKDSTGTKVSILEFLRRLDTLTPEQREGILRESRKYKGLDDD